MTVEPTPDPRGAVQVERLSRTQRTIVRRMAESRSTVPSFTLTAAVAMGPALGFRAGLKEGGGPVPTINDLIVKACALALRRNPGANAAYSDGGQLERFERVNVGFAVAAQGALLVPTVFDADRRSLAEIAAETRRLVQAARERMIAPEDLGGATFTVSNLGMFRVDRFDAVINPPQAAILAVGRTRRVGVVDGDGIVPGEEMALTLTCDHRVLYGADGAELLGAICEEIESPGGLERASGHESAAPDR